MRKKLSLFTGAVLVAIMLFATTVLAEAPVKLIVDGKELQPDVPPQIIEERTMVPLRWVAEALGADVEWDESTRTIFINKKSDAYENPLRYPKLSEEITTPKELLEAYFATLSVANHLTPEQMGAAGGSLGLGNEPYATAYDFWSAEWRANHTYEDFLHAWSGTAHVELIQLHEASMQDGEARFFVETKHLESVRDEHRFGEFYYSGFFSVGRTDEGWKITNSSLESQNLAWELGGHMPWLADPKQVAIVHGLDQRTDEQQVSDPLIIYHADNHVTIVFTDDDQRLATSVELVRTRDGIWKVIAVEQEIPFSNYVVNANEEIHYSKEETQVVMDFSRSYGIQPLLPEKGLASDYLIKVRLRKNAMEFIYPHFSVTQSNQYLGANLQDEQVESITLPDGEQAWWFHEQRILYFEMDGVYISIDSAKSVGKDEFIRIAQSLVPVTQLST